MQFAGPDQRYCRVRRIRIDEPGGLRHLSCHSRNPLHCNFIFSCPTAKWSGNLSSFCTQLLLVNLLLATLDRWVALTYPLFHRENVTVRLVVLVQLFFFTIVVVLSTLPYWAEWIPLSGCGVHPTVLEWTTIVFFGYVYSIGRDKLRHVDDYSFVLASLTLLSIVAQVQIYCRARSCLRRNLEHQLFNHQQHRITRLELEATITLVCGVVSLCFFSLPYSSVSLFDWICRRQHSEQQWCSTVQCTLPYARELFLVHSVYNPIMYMIRSREFSEALRSILSCPWSRKG